MYVYVRLIGCLLFYACMYTLDWLIVCCFTSS